MTLSADFYGPSGEPVGGVVPPSIHIFGNGDHQRALQATEGHLISFMHDVRLSTAPHHRIEVDLGDGATALMRSAFGVVTVDVLTSANEPQGEPFYGGILLMLKAMSPDNAAAYAVDALFGSGGGGNLLRPDLKYTPSHIKSAGFSAFKEGRPAAPGTEDDDLAEGLIIQIAKDKPLANGIETGAIKIYRIADAVVGEVVEVNDEEGAYLLSTSLGSGEYRDFYYCGKRVESIPPLTVVEDPVQAGVRLRTVGFGAPSFELGAAAGGIVIMAVERRLYALNTASETGEPATWTLLDTGALPAVSANTYGTVFTETVNSNGSLTVVCSGTNGVGQCSGFSVTITPVPGRLPTITGSCNIVASPDTTATGGTPSYYTHNISFDCPPVRYFTAADMWTTHDIDDNLTVHTGSSQFSWMSGGSLTAASVLVPASGGTPARVYDRFLGGEVPMTEPRPVYTHSASSSAVYTPFEVWSNSTRFPLAAWDFADGEYGEFGAAIKEGTGGVTSTATARRTFLGGEITATVTGGTSSHSIPSSHSWGEQEVGKRRYSATDRHTGKLAFRSDQGRSGSIALTGRGGPTYGYLGLVFFSGEWTTTLSAWRFTHRLLRPDGTAVTEWGNMGSLMPGIAPFMRAVDLGLIPTYDYWVEGPYYGDSLHRVSGGTFACNAFPAIANYIFGDLWRTDTAAVPWPATRRWPLPGPGIVTGGSGGRFTEWESWSVAYTSLSGTRTLSLEAFGAEFKCSRISENLAAYAWLSSLYTDPAYYTESAVTYDAGWVLPTEVTEVVVGGSGYSLDGSTSTGDTDPVWPRAGWDRLYELKDHILYDVRTGGFIAQMYWYAEHTDDPSFPEMMVGAPLTPTYCEILIGNSTGTVPLQDILNAWKELGETAGSPDEYLARAIFIDSNSLDVMLI